MDRRRHLCREQNGHIDIETWSSAVIYGLGCEGKRRQRSNGNLVNDVKEEIFRNYGACFHPVGLARVAVGRK